MDIGFFSATDNVDLYNINNTDKHIDLREIEEDARSFQERLKSLEHERNSVNITPSKNKIDFTAENFSNTQTNNIYMKADEIPDYEPKTVEQIREEKDMIEMRKRQEIKAQDDFKRHEFETMRKDMIEQRTIDQQTIDKRTREPYRQDIIEQRTREPYRQDDVEQIRYNSTQELNNVNHSNIPLKHQPPIQLTKALSNKNLDISKIQNTLKKLGMVNASEIEYIKKENEMLKNKLEYFSENKLDSVKQEISFEFNKLNEREILISKKEEDMKLLMKKYHYLYGTTNIQLDISPIESRSDFSFEFEPIKYIIGIKLMSYSIPQPRYNIEVGKNNIFRIKNTNNEIIELILNSGKYVIDNLIEKLNTKSEKYKFELNEEQIVEITSDESFEIIPTPLSNEILGFISLCKETNKYIAEKPWDLRIEEKVFLFLNNIDYSTPFAVLYINNQGNYQFKFEKPIILNKLDLSFKDSKGRPFNFYNLTYSLNIQLEIENPIEELSI